MLGVGTPRASQGKLTVDPNSPKYSNLLLPGKEGGSKMRIKQTFRKQQVKNLASEKN